MIIYSRHPPKYIRLGELDLASNTDDATTTDYKITEIHAHPDFVHRQNDIAIIKFRGVSSFTAYIRPICLNVHEEIPNRKLSAQGWGYTTFSGDNYFPTLSLFISIN